MPYADPNVARAKRKEKYWADPQAARARRAAWRAANPEKALEGVRSWRAADPVRARLSTYIGGLKWRAANQHKRSAYERQRAAAKRNAAPAWADNAIVEALYELAAAYRAAGLDVQVDHIVPIRSKVVSGFHCEANLNLLFRVANSAKGNRVWPDMPEES